MARGGQHPYPVLSMFKLILLGQWHSLSDQALEDALHVRLDFMVVTGFEMGSDMPDASTLCRFRNRLLANDLHSELLREVNRQLMDLGLKIEGAHAALVDATIITSAARPDKVIHTSLPNDDQTTDSPVIQYSADTDARWLKKGSRSYYGYRGYAAVDEIDGYVEHVHMTPANESEQKQLAQVINRLDSNVNEVLTDKGFSSKDNRALLAARGLQDGLSKKASRHHPLSQSDKNFNKMIAKRRFKVEQAFGTMKRLFGLNRGRYFGTGKTELQMMLAAIGMNLLKAQRKLEAIQG
jgi:transposase, IS5 family